MTIIANDSFLLTVPEHRHRISALVGWVRLLVKLLQVFQIINGIALVGAIAAVILPAAVAWVAVDRDDAEADDWLEAFEMIYYIRSVGEGTAEMNEQDLQ